MAAILPQSSPARSRPTKDHLKPRKTRRQKPLPPKPYPEFPLTPHRSGKWCKRINGHMYYFGRLDDWESALEQYAREMPYLKAGKTPPPDAGTFTLADLCNLFLEFKDSLVESGELTKGSFDDYRDTCKRMVAILGKKHLVSLLEPRDFAKLRAKLAKRFGPTSLGNEINRCRIVFKWAYDQELVDKPIRFGQGFKRPSPKTIRLQRAEKKAKYGVPILEAHEIRKLLAIAPANLKAMILLGINCGLGNEDCGRLQLKGHLDLRSGWLDFPRPKTGIERRAKLWPETVEAIETNLKARPNPKTAEARPLVFRTKRGFAWSKGSSANPVSQAFRKLLDEAKLYRPGIGFYSLRRGFETIAGESKDQVAVNHVMGHGDGTMASIYRQRISDERLEFVAEHVHRWLFDSQTEGVRDE